VLVVHNLGPDPETLSLEVEGTRAEPLLATGGASGTREAGAVQLTLPPHASAAFKL
jgi:hypothetical protein